MVVKTIRSLCRSPNLIHILILAVKKKMNPWQYPPSAGMFYSPVSSHYAQAYLQNSFGGFQQQRPISQMATSSAPTSASAFQQRPRFKGTHKCTYDQWTFSGSQKTVEIHMMDRHLIYPSNYNKNRQRDWDTDPSLKGHVYSYKILHHPSPPPRRALTYS